MNSSIDIPSDSKTCEGRCILEMQKILEPSVIVEFFEVVRDFHNDDRTATKLKNIILSETSEAIKLLNERASEMILMVDEVFLNRRQRQSSFYRLCHKLARKRLPEGSHLPDESKCVCFSEENLRKFGVDPGAITSVEFSSNMMLVREALKQYFGELRCTDCGSNMMSCVTDCSCSGPSLTSQHKVHEAILELCKPKNCQDFWYLTQLKRDADYYRSRCRKSSLSSSGESVNSFEVISPPNRILFEDPMDNESLGSDFQEEINCFREEMLKDTSKFLDPPQKLKDPNAADIQNLSKIFCPPAADIQNFSKNLNNKLMHCFQPLMANLTDASKGNPQCTTNEECKAGNVKMCEKKFCPADVLKKSFSPYFDKRNKAQMSYRPTRKNDYIKATVCPAECIRQRLQKLHVNSESAAANRGFVPSCKERMSNPSDSLKCALNSYFKKEASEIWLRN